MHTDYKFRLKELFDSCRFEKYGYVSEFFIARALGKFYGCKYIVYGAGKNARAVVNYLVRTEGFPVEYIVDSNPQKGEIEGIRVISREEFSELNRERKEKWCVLVSISKYRTHGKMTYDIDSYLYSEGAVKIIKATSQCCTKMDWYDYFFENKQKFLDKIDLLADDTSKETYFEFIRAYLEGHSYKGRTFPEEEKYFLTKEDIEHYEDEQWINFGAYTGDTIYHFINQGFAYKKIYAVEGDTEIAQELMENLSLLPAELKNNIQIINQYFGGIPYCSLDHYFADDKITYINMDIEGAEEEVLKSAQNIIKKNRPVLAVCVYHKKDDLLVIPDLIRQIVSGYSFFLRKYPSCIGNYFDGYFELNELVLYAVPNERVKCHLEEQL